MAMVGGDAFGVELEPVNRRAVVAHCHHYTILAPRIGSERRNRLSDCERMVAGRGEGRGQAGEQAVMVVADIGDLAVHRRHSADLLPAGERDRLVTEAYAEQGPSSVDAAAREVDRDSRTLRAARPR